MVVDGDGVLNNIDLNIIMSQQRDFDSMTNFYDGHCKFSLTFVC